MDVFRIFVQYFVDGGILMVPIFLVSLVAWYMSFERWGMTRRFTAARKKYLSQIEMVHRGIEAEPKTGDANYDLLLETVRDVRFKGKVGCGEVLFSEFLIAAIPALKLRLSTISCWASVAPLLGLLGTVMGMVATFQIITDFGLGNPNLMAQGISIALLTTQAGLTVAFPMVMLHNHLAARSKYLIDQLLLDGEELVNRMREWEPSIAQNQ